MIELVEVITPSSPHSQASENKDVAMAVSPCIEETSSKIEKFFSSPREVKNRGSHTFSNTETSMKNEKR